MRQLLLHLLLPLLHSIFLFATFDFGPEPRGLILRLLDLILLIEAQIVSHAAVILEAEGLGNGQSTQMLAQLELDSALVILEVLHQALEYLILRQVRARHHLEERGPL